MQMWQSQALGLWTPGTSSGGRPALESMGLKASCRTQDTGTTPLLCPMALTSSESKDAESLGTA